ncbi:MAG: DUF6220 domain-containing protein [Ktedonobacterales bacterium]
MQTAVPTLPTSAPAQADIPPTYIDDDLKITFIPVRAEQRAARIHRLLARVLLGGLTLQVFFAGLGVFAVSTFLPHAILGSIVILTSFALPIVAWRAHLKPSITRRSWLLAGLMILQGLLIDVGRIVHIVAALHPVNAMLLVLLTYSLARRQQ